MITVFGNADFAMAPMLFDRSIVISATFRRISSGNNISFSMTSDGFVPFIIEMTVCLPPCPSLLWRMVYTSWQKDVSSKPKWSPSFLHATFGTRPKKCFFCKRIGRYEQKRHTKAITLQLKRYACKDVIYSWL